MKGWYNWIISTQSLRWRMSLRTRLTCWFARKCECPGKCWTGKGEKPGVEDFDCKHLTESGYIFLLNVAEKHIRTDPFWGSMLSNSGVRYTENMLVDCPCHPFSMQVCWVFPRSLVKSVATGVVRQWLCVEVRRFADVHLALWFCFCGIAPGCSMYDKD